MSRWWRAYDEAVDDPKLQRLPPAVFKGWFNLMCLASANGGALPAIADIAFKLRMTMQRASALVAELVSAGLIDKREDGGFEPHNWSSRQYKSDVTDPTNAARQKRYRDRHRNGQNTVTETVTHKRPETEQIQKQNAASAAPDPEADLFRRGKEVLGKSAGGLIKQLLEAKDGKANLARAAIETAAGKQDPREYIGGVIRNADQSSYVDGRL